MKFMLDTNTCIALVKREPLQVWQRFEALSAGDVGISWVTMTELEFGVAKSQHQEKNQAALDEFVLPLETAPMDIDTARCYGQLRARLQAQGNPIGPMDDDWRSRVDSRRDVGDEQRWRVLAHRGVGYR